MATLWAKKKSWEDRKFPPYELMETARVSDSQEKYRRLENLYHKTQAQSWDGRELLRKLLDKHGGIHIPPAKRKAISEVFAIILWGELAAWQIGRAHV